jgi:CRP-like cAMP-binding protein
MTVLFEDLGASRDQEAQRKRILQLSPALRSAPRAARDGFAQVARLFKAGRRARLAGEGLPADRVFLLASGRVRLERRTPSGKVVHLAHLGRGDFVGDLTLSGAAAGESAVVVEEARGLSVSVEDLREFAAREHGLYLALGAAMMERSRALEDRLEALLLRRVEARLAWLLLYAIERWGEEEAGGRVVIGTAIRHHEIASMIGTGREWVTMTLMRLRKRGILDASGRRVVVLDIEALRSLAAGCALE